LLLYTQRDRAQAAQWRNLRCDALRSRKLVLTKNLSNLGGPTTYIGSQ
jgi:hypothetical protein